MIINFRIHYKTSFGERIRIKYTKDAGFDKGFKYREFITYDGENWIAQLILEEEGPLYYKYEVLKNREIKEEGLKPRVLDSALTKELKSIHVRDFWKATDSSKNVFYSTAFSDILLKRDKIIPSTTKGAGRFYVEFNLASPDFLSISTYLYSRLKCDSSTIIPAVHTGKFSLPMCNGLAQVPI